MTAKHRDLHACRDLLGRVAIVVVPWSAPLFMERSRTQHFGPQERSIFLDRSETSLHPSQSRNQDGERSRGAFHTFIISFDYSLFVR